MASNFKILSISCTVSLRDRLRYIEAYVYDHQRAIKMGGVTQEFTETFPYILQVFDTLEADRKPIDAAYLSLDEFSELMHDPAEWLTMVGLEFHKSVDENLPRV